MALSKYQTAGKLILLGRESNDETSSESERLLVNKSQRFSYRISIPYNKPIGQIEELTLDLITT